VLLSILVLGPVMTTLPLGEYFANPHTRGYLQNLWLHIVYYLPGVFEHLRVPNAVNGSLWSLPVEFLMCIIVALLGLARASRWIFMMTAIGSAIITAVWAMSTREMLVIYNFDVRQVFLCGTYFWVGVVFQKFQLRRYFSASGSQLALIALICLEPWPQYLQFAGWVLIPFLVLSFGFAHSPMLRRLTRSGDYSYGVYIYAFPVQQSVVYLWPGIDIGLYLLVCSLVTLGLAAASWHLVEKRALLFKPARPRVTAPTPTQ
jgi:peptidoglycan/LPS O-acetylase OafA/YrhL